MTAKSILLTEDEVQEILDAPANATLELVRIVRPQPPKYLDWVGWEIGGGKDEGKAVWAIDDRNLLKNALKIKPPYAAGDDLWGRETWALSADADEYLRQCDATPAQTDGFGMEDDLFYAADGGGHEPYVSRWRPSVHMPRWASRIALRVKGVETRRESGNGLIDIEQWVWVFRVEVVR